MIDFEGDRETWDIDENWISPVGSVVTKAGEDCAEFVGGKVTGFKFGRVDRDA